MYLYICCKRTIETELTVHVYTYMLMYSWYNVCVQLIDAYRAFDCYTPDVQHTYIATLYQIMANLCYRCTYRCTYTPYGTIRVARESSRGTKELF